MKLLNPVVSKQEWIKLYKITDKTIPCPECRKELELTIPFASGNWRGLSAAPHEPCGDVGVCTAISVNEEFNQAISSLFESFRTKD